jgi:tetratricopeptide (TPR) repeat protein
MKRNPIFIFFFFISVTSIFTQTKIFTREYSYNAGEADSKLSSRVLALTQVKRILLEEIGMYLESTFETKKEEKQFAGQVTLNELTTQQITTFTAGVTNTKILDEKWNGETYYIKAEITVDVDDVTKQLKVVANDKEKIKELDALQKQVDDANNQIEKLKKELADAKTKPTQNSEVEKNKIQSSYNEKINILTANDWFQKGGNAHKAKDYKGAIDYYTKAIEFNPQLAPVYANRGSAKLGLEDHRGAIEDYNKAIEINPKYDFAFSRRGHAKLKLQDYNGAIEDCNTAIEINPQNTSAYSDRANTKMSLGDYRGAIEDCNKAIEINPQYASAYVSRGLTKVKIQDYEGAIEDYNKAISIVPQDAIPYYNIACIYSLKKDLNQSLLFLEKSFVWGFNKFKWIEKDSDFDNIRNTDEFKNLIEKYNKK